MTAIISKPQSKFQTDRRREQIAIAAMQGILAKGDGGPEFVAKRAIAYADALIAHLEE